MGGASLIGILFSIVRMKFAAIHLGPTGIGYIGLFQNFIYLASTVAGIGISTVAPRQVASQRALGGEAAEYSMSKVVIEASVFLGLIGMVVVWAFRHLIADTFLGSPSLTGFGGFLALAVFFTVLSGTQVGVLTGLGRVGQAAKVTVWCNVAVTPLFLLSLYVWPKSAVAVLLISLPACSAVAGWYFLRANRRHKPPAKQSRNFQGLIETFSLGITVTITGGVTLLAQLLVRRLLLGGNGEEALGQFQAAWAIGSMYLMLALQAMSADFFPRLSASKNVQEHNRLINEQTEIALILSAPFILGLMGFATIGIEILYGHDFVAAATTLRWQMLGDVLKILSWPLGYALLARRRQASYFACECLANVLFVASTWWLLPRFGIEAPGIAYFIMYLGYLPAVHWAANADRRFSWNKEAKRTAGLLILISAGLFLLFGWNKWAGMVTSLGFVGYAVLRAKRQLMPMLARKA